MLENGETTGIGGGGVWGGTTTTTTTVSTVDLMVFMVINWLLWMRLVWK